jgi:dsDNA-specific endonuclease/ATPase MutS2
VSDETVVPVEDPAMVELKAENERLKAHHAKLLDETKTAKQRAAELDKASQDAEIARQHEQGEYKTLAERYKAEAEAERKTHMELKGSIANQELDALAIQRAMDEANSPANAKLMSRFIRDQLEYTDAGVIGKGGKSVDDAVKELFATGDFESLRKGNQSNGGSAPGSKSSGAGDKTVTREAWDGMSQTARAQHAKSGGTVV